MTIIKCECGDRLRLVILSEEEENKIVVEYEGLFCLTCKQKIFGKIVGIWFKEKAPYNVCISS